MPSLTCKPTLEDAVLHDCKHCSALRRAERSTLQSRGTRPLLASHLYLETFL